MFEGIDPSIALLLSKFVENPKHLSHLLFVGPPGSGKTTTANNLVKAFYPGKKHYIGKALFLNSSDERSLEAVRSKVYPFAKSQMHTIFAALGSEEKPKIIIFDEAETLTEQAQSALRPLLDKPASNLLIVFLCNSISRIHGSILHRFLRVSFETASANKFRERFSNIFEKTYSCEKETADSITSSISPSDIQYRRGDIRFFLLHISKARECSSLGWQILHCKKTAMASLLQRLAQTQYIGILISQILFFFRSLGALEASDITTLLEIADADILSIRPLNDTLVDLTEWVLRLKCKFETLME